MLIGGIRGFCRSTPLGVRGYTGNIQVLPTKSGVGGVVSAHSPTSRWLVASVGGASPARPAAICSFNGAFSARNAASSSRMGARAGSRSAALNRGAGLPVFFRSQATT